MRAGGRRWASSLKRNKKNPHPAAAGSVQKKKIGQESLARSSKHPLVLADSSSSSDSEVSEEVHADGSRNCHRVFSAERWGNRSNTSRCRESMVFSGGSRKRKDFSGGSRNRKDAISAPRSKKTNEDFQRLVESYVATNQTLVSHLEIKKIKKFVASVFPIFDCEYATSKVIVHTLTATNVNKKEMKLPSRALAKELARSAEVMLSFLPYVSTEGSYMVLDGDDGRVKIIGWDKFIEKLEWEVNSKIVMLFCHSDDKAWLFFNQLG